MSLLLQQTYTELSVKGRGKRAFDIAKDFWMSQKIPWNQIAVFEDKKDKTRFSLTYYFSDFKKARNIQKNARGLAGGLRLTVKILRPKDWAEKWKENYHIFSLGRKFDLIPEWEKNRYRAYLKTPIFLNPRSAFGSGKHESTRFMTRLISEYFVPGMVFLDLGCGTGILSVAAMKLGASSVRGIDIEPYSVKAARENYDLNQGTNGSFQSADIGKLRGVTPVDFIAANLSTDILIQSQKSISKWLKPGGYLAISGVLLKNLKEFKRSFLPTGEFQCLSLLQGRRWTAALFQKRA